MNTQAPQRFIYVIGPLAGLQKIGLTMDPKARLATLQTASAEDLVLHLAVRVPFGEAHAIERRAHRLLERSRVRNEWFDATPEAAMAVVLTAAKPLPDAGSGLTAIRRSTSVDALPLFSFARADSDTAPAPQSPRRPLWQACRVALGRR